MAITILGSSSGTETISINSPPSGSVVLPGGGISIRGAYPVVPSAPDPTGVLKVISSPFALTNPVQGPIVYAISSYSTFTPNGTVPQISGGGRHFNFFKIASPSGTSPTSPFLTNGYSTDQSSVGNITNTGPTATTVYASSSDHRLKENIAPVENGLDYIMPLRPRKFSWKSDGTEAVGFIAHELQEDFPPLDVGLVSGEKDAVEITVNLYKEGELLLNDLNEPLTRIKPFGLEEIRLADEGYTWVTVSEKQINQQISTRSLISPIVASVQQLHSLTIEQKKEIDDLKLRIQKLKVMKNV